MSHLEDMCCPPFGPKNTRACIHVADGAMSGD